MPTYAYACTSCDHHFEVQQRFSDSTLTDCPACEGRLRKLFNSVGIVFKGSGFYRTDSRGNGAGDSPEPSGAAKAESSANGKGTANGKSGSDTNGSGTKEGSSSSGSGGSGSEGAARSGTSGSTARSPAASGSSGKGSGSSA